MVVRDHAGEVWFLKSKLAEASSAQEAELQALLWSFKLASQLRWPRPLWFSDAHSVVNEINETGGAWRVVYARYLLLECRSLVSVNNWSLQWCSRSTNRLADTVSKFSLHHSLCLDFAFSFCVSHVVKKAVVADLPGSGLSL